jgi:hypothetical protein
MGWVIKDTILGHYVLGVDSDGYAQFSGNFNTAWWWETEDDANWFIETNDIEGVTAEDSGGENPPGNGQPGKP